MSNVKYKVFWTENKEVKHSDCITDAEGVWEELRKHHVSTVPEAFLVVGDTNILVASLFSVNWLYLVDYPKLRTCKELVDAVDALIQANPGVHQIGRRDSIGALYVDEVDSGPLSISTERN